MQGRKLCPILFNVFINDLLTKLHNSLRGATVGKFTLSALGFADDIALIADTPESLQALIDNCAEWSRTNDMSFNVSKCKILVLNTSKKGLSFRLSDTEIDLVDSVKYLGITLSRKRQTSHYSEHINQILQKAETRTNVIRHFGFHSDGLRPATSIKMYKILARPILQYAAQVISYKHYFLKDRKAHNIETPTSIVTKLENFQNRVLKKLIRCPKATPPALLRLITGTTPISARLDMLKLRYH